MNVSESIWMTLMTAITEAFFSSTARDHKLPTVMFSLLQFHDPMCGPGIPQGQTSCG